MTEYLVNKYGKKLQTTLVEVQVNGTGGKYHLPDDAILRGKKLVGAFVPSNADDNAISPDGGRNLVSDSVVRSSFLTLKMENDEVIHKHPLSDFLQTTGDRDVRYLEHCGFNPQKSFIEISNATLITSGESFVIQFIYVD